MRLVLKILSLLFILWASEVFADIYKCEDPQTGQVVFTNVKEMFPYMKCQVCVKEYYVKGSKNVNRRNFYSFYSNLDEKWFEKIGKDYNIDPALLKAIAKVESSFNPRAVSPKGALGVMQLLPTTAKIVGVNDPFDPLENLKGGALYLKKLLEEFEDLSLALAAYNAGPEKVRIYGGIPPYQETRQYVKRVLYYYNLFKD